MSSYAAAERGRLVLVGLVGLYFAAIGVGSLFMPYDEFWTRYLLVTTSRPSFLDTHNFTSAMDCSRLGYDVMRANPCEPNMVAMTYPRLWLGLKWLGVTEGHSTLIGLSMATAFLASLIYFAGALTVAEGVYWAAVVCSPSIMMAVETGNNDLAIFLLVMLAFAGFRTARPISGPGTVVTLLFASALKFFPVASFAYLLGRDRREARRTLGLTAVLFGVYLWWSWADLLVIRANVQRSTYLSFGGVVLWQALGEWGSPWLQVPIPRPVWATLASCGLIAACALLASRSVRVAESPRMDAFRIGTATYGTCFVLWSNWDYRFIFLLLAVPQMLRWRCEPGRVGRLTWLALIALVSTLWLSSGAPRDDEWGGVRTFVVDELLNWYLFSYGALMLASTTPEWLHPLMARIRREADRDGRTAPSSPVGPVRGDGLEQ